MSEFYNYDHDLSAGTSFVIYHNLYSIRSNRFRCSICFSDEQTFTLTNGLGTLTTLNISSIAANTGVISSMSTTTDPTTSGTGSGLDLLMKAHR